MTWARLEYVQGLANIFGPQNRTQGHCGPVLDIYYLLHLKKVRTSSSNYWTTHFLLMVSHFLGFKIRPEAKLRFFTKC